MHAPRRTPPHEIAALDAVRGVAIALVFAHHCEGPINGLGKWLVPYGPVRAYVANGHTGVTLFFLLSGFLITRPFLRELFDGRRVSRRAYFTRRARRILPLYFAAVAVGTITNARSLADLRHGLPYLAFLHGFGLTTPLPEWSWVWWSLATEVQFYLLLPALVSLWARHQQLAALGVVAYAVTYLLYAVGLAKPLPPAAALHLSESLFGQAPTFLVGAVLAFAYDRRREQWQARAARWLASGRGDVALLAVLYLLGEWLRYIGRWKRWDLEAAWPIFHVPEALLWGAVVGLLLFAPLVLRRAIVTAPLCTLGLLSYSVYVLHVPVILAVVPWVKRWWPALATGWHVGSVGLCLAIAAVTLALAHVTYRLIERPWLQRPPPATRSLASVASSAA